MKKWAALIFVFFITNCFSQTNISPQFSELKRMEDQQGNTHLLYRIYLYQPGGPLGDYYENSIYHFDLESEADTLFLFEGGRIGDQVIRIIDVGYWNNNPAEFIYIGEGISVDPVAFIQRFDTPDPTFSELGEAFGLELGRENDSLVIASAPYLVKSTDGGFNWTVFMGTFGYLKIISISPFNDNVIFFKAENNLFKTTDGGMSITIVDTSHLGNRFFYDPDLVHIYSLGNNDLLISDNYGNAFSWSNRYSSSNSIYISADYSQPGKIYLADGRKIYVTVNYGITFNEYKVLDRGIVGIYKKPNSNKLYTATKYKIYEITPDIIQVINPTSTQL